MTDSTCEQCGDLVPAKVITDGSDVYFDKFCVKHGETRTLVRRDVKAYLRAQRYVKPGWVPREFSGNDGAACPEGCGFCRRHEQHLCMPIVEITTRCDLACPICINSSGNDAASPVRGWDMSPEELRRVVDGLLSSEGQVDLLNVSGGEPLVHPRLLQMLDETLSREGIVRVSLSTNGLRFLEQPHLLEELRRRQVVVSLQFDGFDDQVYGMLRGRRILGEKLAILERLEALDITTSLVMTAVGGVNDDQLPAILEYLFTHKNVVSLMIQPMSFVGRGAAFRGRFQRLTIPDVIGKLSGGNDSSVRAEDFVPLPCSHPLCFALAYYLIVKGGGRVSINRLVDASTFMESISNRPIFGLAADEYQKLKSMIYDLWSGPKGMVPDSDAVLATLQGLLREMSSGGLACGAFDPRKAFMTAEKKVKSVFIHAFQDVETFDLSRVRRCCQAYPQPDGRLMPACVHNVLRRSSMAEGAVEMAGGRL